MEVSIIASSIVEPSYAIFNVVEEVGVGLFAFKRMVEKLRYKEGDRQLAGHQPGSAEAGHREKYRGLLDLLQLGVLTYVNLYVEQGQWLE